jgi:predicted metal-dependent hydrolase
MVSQLNLGDMAVDVVRKDIKNVHLSVHPPTGRVRISAPARMSLDTIRIFAISKLGWIRRQQTKIRGQARETPREYRDRESHYVWGKRYLLKVIESDERPPVELKHDLMVLRLRRGTHAKKKQAVVEEWYREQVRQALPPLIAKWETHMGVMVNRFFVRRMKTKWGSCNPRARSIRFNTELAKKPPELLEYIVVHELAHLLVRHHNARFGSLMDKCLPNWKLLRQRLNEAPIDHHDWEHPTAQ